MRHFQPDEIKVELVVQMVHSKYSMIVSCSALSLGDEGLQPLLYNPALAACQLA